jgi:hypothetical protein
MNSLVKRLRKSHAVNDGMFPELGEAADEIERLETDKAEISKTASDLLHENEKLRAEKAALEKIVEDMPEPTIRDYQD